MKFTINSIDASGQVNVTFDFDGTEVEQNIVGLPMVTPEMLTEALFAYGEAYLKGKEIEAAQEAKEPSPLNDIIGQTIEAPQKEEAPQEEPAEEVSN